MKKKIKLKGSMTVEMIQIFPVVFLLLLTIVSMLILLFNTAVCWIRSGDMLELLLSDTYDFQTIYNDDYTSQEAYAHIIERLDSADFKESIEYDGKLHTNYINTSLDMSEKTEETLEGLLFFIKMVNSRDFGNVNLTPVRYRDMMAKILA